MLTALLMIACNGRPIVDDLEAQAGVRDGGIPIDRPVDQVDVAVAPVHGRDGSELGRLRFERSPGWVTIEGELRGLDPKSEHAIHIHEGSSCGDDFAAAGRHFAPDDNPHGVPGMESHAGDLGNLVVDEDGVADIALTNADIALGGEDSVIVRTVVVHADADDLESQPSGAAGTRIACGVIQAHE